MTKPSLAELNDSFRKGDPKIPGKLLITKGVQSFPEPEVKAIIKMIQEFDDFNEGNDPHGEHDFGSIIYNSEKLFWKMDYYDLNLQYHSDDPTDLTKTIRVLTIMKASEY